MFFSHGPVRLLFSIRQLPPMRTWTIARPRARPIALAWVLSWCGAQPAASCLPALSLVADTGNNYVDLGGVAAMESYGAVNGAGPGHGNQATGVFRETGISA